MGFRQAKGIYSTLEEKKSAVKAEGAELSNLETVQEQVNVTTTSDISTEIKSPEMVLNYSVDDSEGASKLNQEDNLDDSQNISEEMSECEDDDMLDESNEDDSTENQTLDEKENTTTSNEAKTKRKYSKSKKKSKKASKTKIRGEKKT